MNTPTFHQEMYWGLGGCGVISKPDIVLNGTGFLATSGHFLATSVQSVTQCKQWRARQMLIGNTRLLYAVFSTIFKLCFQK